MNLTILLTIAATGFSVAFLHAAIPTHWLPFVLVARARAWSTRRALGVTALAGLGHVALTSLLGLLIAWFGFQLEDFVGRFSPWIAGGILLALSAYYGWRQLQGRGICHHHVPGGRHQPGEACGHEHQQSHWEVELRESNLGRFPSGDWATVGGLFLMLTLSPCLEFLWFYVPAVQFGWTGFLVLSGILAVATLTAMLVFTWLALVGLERFQLRRFEHVEAGLLSALFAALGLLILILEH